MKTSDKLLLTFFVSVLVVFFAIHLTLYSQLRQGRITTSMRPTGGWVRPYKGKAPNTVVLEGNINVTLAVSDSFYVDIPKDAEGKISCRLTDEGSLVIKGDSIASMNPHSFFQNYRDFPWVSVHAGRHTPIRLKGLLALLAGGDKPGGVNLNVQATDAQLWFGETYGTNGTDYPTQYYDSLQVQAENTNLVLHKNAVIGHLSGILDDRSELNDQHANIDSISLQYTPLTKINLTGINLDKLRHSGH